MPPTATPSHGCAANIASDRHRYCHRTHRPDISGTSSTTQLLGDFDCPDGCGGSFYSLDPPSSDRFGRQCRRQLPVFKAGAAPSSRHRDGQLVVITGRVVSMVVDGRYPACSVVKDPREDIVVVFEVWSSVLPMTDVGCSSLDALSICRKLALGLRCLVVTGCRHVHGDLLQVEWSTEVER